MNVTIVDLARAELAAIKAHPERSLRDAALYELVHVLAGLMGVRPDRERAK